MATATDSTSVDSGRSAPIFDSNQILSVKSKISDIASCIQISINQEKLAVPGTFEALISEARFSWDHNNLSSPCIMFGFKILNIGDVLPNNHFYRSMFRSISNVEIDFIHNVFKFYKEWLDDQFHEDISNMGYDMANTVMEIPELFEKIKSDQRKVLIEITYHNKEVFIREPIE